MSELLLRLKKYTSSSAVRRNIGMTLGRQLLAAFAQFVLVVLIARELGPEGNGYYAMAIFLSTMLSNFLNLGIGSATVYYISRGEVTAQKAMVDNFRLALIISAVGITCALPVLIVWNDTIFPGVPQSLLYLGLLSFPLTLLLAYLNTILQGLKEFKAFNLTIIIPPYINLAGVIIAFYFLRCGVIGIMVAYIVSQLIGLASVFGFLKRNCTGQVIQTEVISWVEYVRKTLGYGWKAHLSNILAFVNYRADIFLVNFFLTPVATGIYVIAVQIAEKLWMLSQAASTVLLPRLSAMHQNPKERLALVNKSFWGITGLTICGSIPVAVALFWLVKPVFGEEYGEVVSVFFWLLPGVIAGAGARIYSNYIAAVGRPELNMYSAIVVVTINISGNVLLVPKYGILGAAWSTSVAYCCNLTLKAWLIKKVH